MRRVAFVLAAGFALLAAPGWSQPPGFAPARIVGPTPLAVIVLPGIDDPAVVADLKLSDEQVKTLVARRQTVWDEVYAAVPSMDDPAARATASDELLKKTLSADQYKRAAQLGAQSVLGGRTFGDFPEDAGPGFRLTRLTAATLTRYPELATVFQLTDEQKKTLTASADARPVRSLTPTAEQQAAAKAFLGTPVKAWTAKTDPRAVVRSAPRELTLLASKDVRADLGLSDEAAKPLTDLRAKWQPVTSFRRIDISPKEAAETTAALATETETALAALTPAQRTRLKQIARQTDGSGPHVEQFYRTATGKEIGLTTEQTATLNGLWTAYREDAAKVFETESAYPAAEKKLHELADARRAKTDAVLTTAQADQLRTLFGKPFTGNTRADTPFTGPGGFNLDQMRAVTFGKYSAELTRLADPTVQAELKLTPEQVKKASEVSAELRTKFTGRTRTGPGSDEFAKLTAERSEFIEAELKKLLTADQFTRLRQIMMQARERTDGFRGTTISSAIAYPGVAEQVKLTADQKKALLAGTAPAEVLTAEQKDAIQKLLGPPFAAAARTSRPLVSRPPAAVRILVTEGGPFEAVLGLTDEQAQAVAAARTKYQTTFRTVAGGAGPGGGFGPSPFERMPAAAEEFDKAVSEVLTDAQKKRLPQLARQAEAARDLRDTLTAPDTAKELAFTAEQTAKLDAVAAEAVKWQDLLISHGPSDRRGQPMALKLRDAADDRLLAVLTDAQRVKWKELTGDPVPGLVKTIPSRFGGGFGGTPFGP